MSPFKVTAENYVRINAFDSPNRQLTKRIRQTVTLWWIIWQSTQLWQNIHTFRNWAASLMTSLNRQKVCHCILSGEWIQDSRGSKKERAPIQWRIFLFGSQWVAVGDTFILQTSHRFRMPILIVLPEVHSISIIFISHCLLLDNAYKRCMLYLSRRLPLNLHTTIYDLFAHLKCIAGTIANETLISIDSPKLSIFGIFLHFEERKKP